jgi:hypothetical protein
MGLAIALFWDKSVGWMLLLLLLSLLVKRLGYHLFLVFSLVISILSSSFPVSFLGVSVHSF